MDGYQDLNLISILGWAQSTAFPPSAKWVFHLKKLIFGAVSVKFAPKPLAAIYGLFLLDFSSLYMYTWLSNSVAKGLN